MGNDLGQLYRKAKKTGGDSSRKLEKGKCIPAAARVKLEEEIGYTADLERAAWFYSAIDFRNGADQTLWVRPTWKVENPRPQDVMRP